MKNKNVLRSFDEDFFMEKCKRINPYSMKSYHYHNCFEIYYLLSGKREYFIKDDVYQINSGSLVFINEFDIHCTGEILNSGYERYVINFSKEFLTDFLSKSQLDLLDVFSKNMHIMEIEEKEKNFIEFLLESMYREYTDKKTGYEMYLKTALVQLLIFAARHSDHLMDKEAPCITSLDKTIAKIIGYINNNYSEEITLKIISEKFFISPYYFSRTFKSVTGFSFTEYLNIIRIKEAQHLLSSCRLTASEVGKTVGFNSQTHFGRVFHKITGITPTAYRKAQK